jgi:hypothetical protein
MRKVISQKLHFDYQIPEKGITEQFKMNSYASACMSLMNDFIRKDMLLEIHEAPDSEGEERTIKVDETIIVEDENGKKVDARIEVDKDVLTYWFTVRFLNKIEINRIKNIAYKKLIEEKKSRQTYDSSTKVVPAKTENIKKKNRTKGVM